MVEERVNNSNNVEKSCSNSVDLENVYLIKPGCPSIIYNFNRLSIHCTRDHASIGLVFSCESCYPEDNLRFGHEFRVDEVSGVSLFIVLIEFLLTPECLRRGIQICTKVGGPK